MTSSEESVDFHAPEILDALLSGFDLSPAQMQLMMESFITGRCDESQMAGLLIALRAKGETAEELAVAASVLRSHMIRLDVGEEIALDTCGTGGDGSGTFNISTAVAFVVAGAGGQVMKHGNRAISGRSGSTDVLGMLGLEIHLDTDWPKRCLAAAGLGFCFAPLYHPALRHVAEARKKLGVRTLFNCLGPLVNPAGTSHQLMGVGRREWLDLLAGAHAELGTKRAILVHGSDGLDEVTLSGPTNVREIRGRTVSSYEWTPDDFGLPICDLEPLRVQGPDESAAMIRSVLGGEPGPALNIVLANAGAALFTIDMATSLSEGVRRAREAILSGRAKSVLEQLRQVQ